MASMMVSEKRVGSQTSQWPAWLTIWVSPRATMRRIVDSDPRHHVLLLAALSGGAAVFSQAQAEAQLSADLSIGVILAATVVIGPLLGWLSLYLNGAILKVTGQMLGGQASAQEVRAAVSWSSLPNTVSLALWAPLLVILRQASLPEASVAGDPDFAMMIVGLLFLVMLLTIVLAVWQAVLFVKCLAEVHRFSAWRALGAILLPWIALFAAVAIPVMLANLFS